MKDQYYILDLFESNNEITIETSERMESPEAFTMPYSSTLKMKFDELHLDFERYIQLTGNDREEEKKEVKKNSEVSRSIKNVISYKNESKYKYILKRKCIYATLQDINYNSSLLEQLGLYRDFFNNCIKEYFFYRLVSAHPLGILAIKFSITLLKNLNFIVFEFLTENKGESLETKYFSEGGCPIQFSFKFFSQIVDIMNFIERKRLVYGDLKLGNLIFDETSNNLKLIDYDASILPIFDNNSTQTLLNMPPGFTAGYVSPELKNKHQNLIEQISDNQRINPWKSDVYSCGVLGLIFSGAIQSIKHLLNFDDNYKEDEKEHDNFIDNLLEYSFWSHLDDKIDFDLTEKMKFLLKKCLFFDPKKRISFKFLHKILKDINIPIDKIKDKVSLYLSKPHGTKKELKSVIDKLNEELNVLNEEKKLLNDKCEEVKDFIEKRYKGIGIIENFLDFNPLIINNIGLLEKMLKWNSLIMTDYNIKRSIVDFSIQFQDINPESVKKILNTININADQILNSRVNPFDKIPLEITKIPLFIQTILAKKSPKYEDLSKGYPELLNDLEILEEKKISEVDFKGNYVGSEQLEFIRRNKVDFFTMKSEILESNYEELLGKLSSEDIRRRIKKTKIKEYWTFYKQRLQFKDIFIIFELVRKSKCNMARINFC